MWRSDRNSLIDGMDKDRNEKNGLKDLMVLSLVFKVSGVGTPGKKNMLIAYQLKKQEEKV